ncbi:unnamed protein product [Dicrocoelium dendriticum]|nr:unnamed protein product [Dicrocoelium dendriticum]
MAETSNTQSSSESPQNIRTCITITLSWTLTLVLLRLQLFLPFITCRKERWKYACHEHSSFFPFNRSKRLNLKILNSMLLELCALNALPVVVFIRMFFPPSPNCLLSMHATDLLR